MSAENYREYQAGSDELIARLVEEHAGWAEAIARSVARAWNLDWQLDGLDGGAYEALLFCSRRFDPQLGVPFRAYARKRIHEATTEEARKSKSWQRGVGANTQAEQDAREISYKLFDMFPELREGLLPEADGDGEEYVRSSIRQMLTGATLLAAFQQGTDNPETAIEYKQMLQVVAELEPVHQQIIWGIYWQGQSMRGLAEEWRLDELTIVREHREIIQFVFSRMSEGKTRLNKKLKIRPGLRALAQQLRKNKTESPFARFAVTAAILVVVYRVLTHYILSCS